jgi:hypothetical protein
VCRELTWNGWQALSRYLDPEASGLLVYADFQALLPRAHADYYRGLFVDVDEEEEGMMMMMERKYDDEEVQKMGVRRVLSGGSLPRTSSRESLMRIGE